MLSSMVNIYLSSFSTASMVVLMFWVFSSSNFFTILFNNNQYLDNNFSPLTRRRWLS